MSCPNQEEKTVEEYQPQSKRVKLQMKNIKIKAILSDAFTQDSALATVHIANIIDRREATNLMNKLPPLPTSLCHLKRIQHKQGVLRIIIAPASMNEEDSITRMKTTLLEGKDENYFKGLDLESLQMVQVPSSQPLTRSQYNDILTYWPCNFHPDKSVEKLLTEENCGFSQHEISTVEQNVNKILESSEENGNRPICLIHDANEVLICTSGLPKEQHALKHCVMMAIDAIARLQGGKPLPSAVTGASLEGAQVQEIGRAHV